LCMAGDSAIGIATVFGGYTKDDKETQS
jgi:hypothetical protein